MNIYVTDHIQISEKSVVFIHFLFAISLFTVKWKWGEKCEDELLMPLLNDEANLTGYDNANQ